MDIQVATLVATLEAQTAAFQTNMRSADAMLSQVESAVRDLTAEVKVLSNSLRDVKLPASAVAETVASVAAEKAALKGLADQAKDTSSQLERVRLRSSLGTFLGPSLVNDNGIYKLREPFAYRGGQGGAPGTSILPYGPTPEQQLMRHRITTQGMFAEVQRVEAQRRSVGLLGANDPETSPAAAYLASLAMRRGGGGSGLGNAALMGLILRGGGGGGGIFSGGRGGRGGNRGGGGGGLAATMGLLGWGSGGGIKIPRWLGGRFAGRWGGGMAGLGSVLGLGGFGAERLFMSGAGVAGSLGGAALGGGLLGLGALGTSAVGMGTDLAGIGQAAGDIKTVSKDISALNDAIKQYGKNSTQAANAQSQLNADLGAFSPVARNAVLAAAQTSQQFKAMFDKLTGPAEKIGAQIIQQVMLVGEKFLPTIGKFAAENMSIIQRSLQPFFSWLQNAGPQGGLGIFTDLEKIFQKNLPTAVHAGTQAFELFMKVMDIAAQHIGGVVKALDSFFTKWNDPSNFGQVKKTVDGLIGLFMTWFNLFKNVGLLMFDIFRPAVGFGQQLAAALSSGVVHLRQWVDLASTQAIFHGLFSAHAAEVIQGIGGVLAGFLPVLEQAISAFMQIETVVTRLVGGALNAFAAVLKEINKIPFLDTLLGWIAALALVYKANTLLISGILSLIARMIGPGGIIGLITTLTTMLSGIGPAAAASAATTDAALADISGAAVAAEAEVSGLSTGLLALGSTSVLAAIAAAAAALAPFLAIAGAAGALAYVLTHKGSAGPNFADNPSNPAAVPSADESKFIVNWINAYNKNHPNSPINTGQYGGVSGVVQHFPALQKALQNRFGSQSTTTPGGMFPGRQLPGSGTTSGLTSMAGAGMFSSPLSPAAQFGRVDQGIDVNQTAPFTAVSPGVITDIRGGMAGGTGKIVFERFSKPIKVMGRTYYGAYYSETSPMVHKGQIVGAGTAIASGGSAELGFLGQGMNMPPLIGGLGKGTKPTQAGSDFYAAVYGASPVTLPGVTPLPTGIPTAQQRAAQRHMLPGLIHAQTALSKAGTAFATATTGIPATGASMAELKQGVTAATQYLNVLQQQQKVVGHLHGTAQQNKQVASEEKAIADQIKTVTKERQKAEEQIAVARKAQKQLGILGVTGVGGAEGTSTMSFINQMKAIGAELKKTPALDTPAIQQQVDAINKVLKQGIANPQVRQAVADNVANLKGEIKDNLAAIVDVAKTAVADASQKLTSLLSEIHGQADNLFQQQTDNMVKNMQIMVHSAAGDFMFGGAITETPAQAALKSLQDAHNAVQQGLALTNAQQALVKANAGGNPQDIFDAQQGVANALYDMQVTSLQNQSDIQSKAADEQLKAAQDAYKQARDVQQAAMDQQIALYIQDMQQFPAETAYYLGKIQEVWAKNIDPTSKVTFTLGGVIYTSFDQALNGQINPAVKFVQEALAALAALPGGQSALSKLTAQYAQLQSISGAQDISNLVQFDPTTGTLIPAQNDPGSGSGFFGLRPPKMASGGVVTTPTLAMIGEAGPEAVIPLSGAGGALHVTHNITIELDGRQISRSVREELIRLGRSNRTIFSGPGISA